MCGSMADIQSAAAEIRRGKKEERRRRRTNHSMKIYMVSLFHRATINQSIYYRMIGQRCLSLGPVLHYDSHPFNGLLFQDNLKKTNPDFNEAIDVAVAVA